MNTRKKLLVLILLGFFQQTIYGQLGFSQEVGFITGPVAFYSDFGERKNVETNLNNVGIGFGIVHYLNFAYRGDFNIYTRRNYFNDHFKVRTELDFHTTNLEHYGRWVEPQKNSLFARQLRAMSASVTVFDIGTRLEYYPLSIRAFQINGFKFSPFFTFGIHWVNFNPKVTSTLGDINSPSSTPDKYYNSFLLESDSTFSFVGSFGVRYKLSQFSDLMLESRWQKYFSDSVDGLNPTFENNGVVEVPENESNDWIYWLSLGYVYYIN